MALPKLSLHRGSTVLELTDDNGITVMPGIEGLDTPPVVLAETDPAGLDGSFVTAVRYQAREVFVPLGLTAGSLPETRARTRAIASLLNPQQGAVSLRVTHAAQADGPQLPADVTDGKASAWEAQVSAVLSDETTIKRNGAQSLKITKGTGLVPYPQARTKAADRQVVIPGESYTVSAYARAVTSATSAGVRIDWFDAGGSLAAQSFFHSVAQTTGWVAVGGTAVAPMNAAKAGVAVEVGNKTGGVSLLNDALLFDDITLVAVDNYREVTGYVSEPIGSALNAGEGLTWRRLGVTLRCPDPLWLASEQIVGGLTSDPTTVNNPGDAVSWPTWGFALASGYPLTITNTSAPGQPTLEVDDALAAVTLNTDPRNLSCVETGTTDSAWSSISQDSVLFGFYPGNNVLTGTNMGGSSLASATFQPRWLTAW